MLTVPANIWNEAVAGQTARVEMIPSGNISGCSASYLAVTASYSFGDCNGNGVPDACDVEDSFSPDLDDNGVPDECECQADVSNDQQIDLADLAIVLANFGEPNAVPAQGDIDGDGRVGLGDLAILLAQIGMRCF